MMLQTMVLRMETVDKELLHAVYTVNLSEEDAAKLKGRMQRKWKINLTVLILGLALFFCGIALPLILYNLGAQFILVMEENIGVLMGVVVAGFAGLFIALFAMNKCVGVAGAYLKALRIAYPGLLPAPFKRDKSYYGIRGEYEPKAYQTGKRNKALLGSLEAGEVDEPRARGLLNYALAGREQARKMLVFSVIFGGFLLGLRVYFVTNSVQILDGSADSFIYPFLLICGLVMLAAAVRWVFVLGANSAYISAIGVGYSQLFRAEHA